MAEAGLTLESPPIGQTITDIASGTTLLSAAIDYEANGLRASRRVSAGSQGEGSSTTSYWSSSATVSPAA